MSVDASAVQQPGANAATPPPAVPDLAGWIGQQAQQAIAKTVQDGAAQITQQATDAATKAATDATSGFQDELAALHTRIGAVEDAAVNTAVATIPQAGAVLVATAQGVATNAEHDVWIPRMLVGISGAAGLIILTGCVLGSHQALDLWGWIWAAFGVAILAGIRMLITTMFGPKPPAA